MQIKSISRGGNYRHGSDVMMVVYMIGRCCAKARHLTLIALLVMAGVAAGRVKAGLALLPRQARMPPAIDLAAVPERVKVAFKTVTDIDHRLVTGAQRSIAG